MSFIAVRLNSISEGVRIALDSVRANKVRAALTILGIAVGVFVVVAISAAVHGVNQAVARDFASTGPTTFFISRYPISFEACDGTDNTCPWLRNPPLRFSEIAAMKRLESVASVGSTLNWQAPAKYRDREIPTASIEGYSAEWTTLTSPAIFPGRAFTAAEERSARRVVVISTVLRDRVFGDLDPMGKMLQLNGVPFEVIGVYEDQSSFMSGSETPKAVVPITALIRYVGARASGLAVAVKPVGETPEERDIAMDEITATLRGQRGLRPAQESNFALITQDKLFETYNSIFGMFFVVMISLSGVGLLVGGVGVVAIMMISVTERTREIGVRKALGATRGTILWQFLVEATTLTMLGGAIGLLVGWLITILIRNFTPIEASIPPMAVVAAIGASCVTGIAFGMLPASRAARLDPVEALRYE